MLLLLALPSYSESKAQFNITILEDYLTNLESNSLTQQILIEDLQKQLDNANASLQNSEQQLKQISQLQDKQSKYLKNLEFKYKNLKIAFKVTVPVTIIATGIVTWGLTSGYLRPFF